MSSFDLQWDHQFCLACDKQTDGATYCSESCRLADYEKTSASSTTSSGASSPTLNTPNFPWSFSNPTTTSSTKFYLSPAYDFSNAQPYGSTPSTSTPAVLATTARARAPQYHHQQRSSQPSLPAPLQLLSPSSSQSSLSSMRSNASSAAEGSLLSDKARRELRAYASSFEQVRLQRRRSY